MTKRKTKTKPKTKTTIKTKAKKSVKLSKQDVMRALRHAIDPETGVDVVTMKMIKAVAIDAAGNVKIKFQPTTPFCPMISYLVEQIEKAAKKARGANRINVEVVAGSSSVCHGGF